MSRKTTKRTITKKKVAEKPLQIDRDVAKQALQSINETAKAQEKYDAQFDGLEKAVVPVNPPEEEYDEELDETIMKQPPVKENAPLPEPPKLTYKTITRADIIVWQAGKSLEEMYQHQEKIFELLKQTLRTLSQKREFINLGSIYSGLKNGGYDIDPQDINKLLRKLEIYPSSQGQNIYKSRLVAGKV